MSTTAWQASLDAHFAQLAASRPVARAVFALEHGLTEAEFGGLVEDIRSDIGFGAPADRLYLPWVVYATEFGYKYSGNEYWQTFERELPGWIKHGSRDWMRDSFRRFSKKYHGVIPTGAWAQQFTIICWPITNAILPADLQLQLASVLDQCRRKISASTLKEPRALGELIRAYSHTCSSRFVTFSEQVDLVGRIAAALLLPDAGNTQNLIHPAALCRIQRDLNSIELARQALDRAKRSVTQRIYPVRRREQPNGGMEGGRDEDNVPLGRPTLCLRPVDPARTTYDLAVEIPSLALAAARDPELHKVLSERRCVIAGSAGKVIARGRLLQEGQTIPLSNLPVAGRPLVSLEGGGPILAAELRTDAIADTSDAYLFKILNDGTLAIVRSAVVRPRKEYVVAARRDVANLPSGAVPVSIRCSGINGIAFTSPAKLAQTEWERFFDVLGLRKSKALTVSPAGLPPIRWDGEASGEWLQGETPRFAIESDHHLQDLTLLSSEARSVVASDMPPNEPILVEFPGLALGVHRTKILAVDLERGYEVDYGTFEITINLDDDTGRVRRRRPLRIELEPPRPTLEELWEGEAAVQLLGPPETILQPVFRFYEVLGRPAFAERTLPNIVLPVYEEAWHQYMDTHVLGKPMLQAAYDQAAACEAEFRSATIGNYKVGFERAHVPLRWSVQKGPDSYHLRLHDDTGADRSATVEFSAYSSPLESQRVAVNGEPIEVDRAGGLYIARNDNASAAVVVSPFQLDGLQGLRTIVHVSLRGREVGHVMKTLKAARLWHSAGCAGSSLAVSKKRDVLRYCAAELSAQIGGDNWGRLENAILNHSEQISTIHVLLGPRDIERRLAEGVKHDFGRVQAAPASRRAHVFAELCLRHLGPMAGIVRESPLYDFAFKLAAGEFEKVDPREPDVQKHINFFVLQAPLIFRAARLIVLLASEKSATRALERGPLYPGWSLA